MIVHVSTATRRRECVQQTQDLAAGENGQDGVPVVKHVEEVLGKGREIVQLQRKEEVVENHVDSAREKQMSRKHAMTINVLFGVNGHRGHNVPLPVVKERGYGKGHVMDQILGCHLKGCTYSNCAWLIITLIQVDRR